MSDRGHEYDTRLTALNLAVSLAPHAEGWDADSLVKAAATFEAYLNRSASELHPSCLRDSPSQSGGVASAE